MTEWWTYRPSDFLMFSAQTYRRLFALYNEAMWPWQLLALAIALGVLIAALRTRSLPARPVILALSAAWLWIGYAFFSQRYAPIHLAGNHFATGAAIQGLVLAWAIHSLPTARIRFVGGVPATIATALWAVALAWPLVGLAAGRPLAQAEVIGFAPDPTALATLAWLAPARGGLAWLLRIVPLAWCAISVTTLATLGDVEAWALALAALLGLAGALGRARTATG